MATWAKYEEDISADYEAENLFNGDHSVSTPYTNTVMYDDVDLVIVP
mgnify:CR=1 FL=1